MSSTANRRVVPSGRGIGFAKFVTKGERIKGIHHDVFELEDRGKTRDNVVWEVTDITVKVYDHGTEVPVTAGDLVCVGMGPQALNGRAKYLVEGNEYEIEYLGEGEAKKAGHNPPKLFGFWEYGDVSDDDEVQAHIDETDDGDVPY